MIWRGGWDPQGIWGRAGPEGRGGSGGDGGDPEVPKTCTLDRKPPLVHMLYPKKHMYYGGN